MNASEAMLLPRLEQLACADVVPQQAVAIHVRIGRLHDGYQVSNLLRVFHTCVVVNSRKSST